MYSILYIMFEMTDSSNLTWPNTVGKLILPHVPFLVPRGDAGEDAGDLDFSALLKKR